VTPRPDDAPSDVPARLDTELVRRGLARSRGDARDLVADGCVLVGGRPATKPAQPVERTTALEVARRGPARVSRAADKLEAALDRWAPAGLSVAGRRCLDVGASTGGFTQVLLDRGAAHVVALDVGHGQLSAAVAEDPRVEDRSGTTVRGLAPQDIGGAADVLVVDLSFISLTLVAAELAVLVAPVGDVITLVKPQFEVGRGRLTKHGVVAKATDRLRALEAVIEAMAAAGLSTHGLAASPVRGGEGNTEYLLWLRRDPSGKMDPDAVAAAARTLVTEGPA